jgi:hypothetical protein
MGGFFVIGLSWLGTTSIRHAGRVRRLAGCGELIRAEVTNTDRREDPRRGTSKIIYSYSFQRERNHTGKHIASKAEEEPWRLEEGKALVLLVAPHGGEHVVLLGGGEPLDLHLPPPLPGGISPTAGPPRSP